MLSSCTTLPSWAPPAPGKSSPAAAPSLQLLRSRQPAAAAAAASVAALRWASPKESQSRAALFACHAAYRYNDIQPSALVNPREKNDSDWRLTDEEDQMVQITKFMVGETSKKNLEVATTEDKVLLIIRYKKEAEEEDKSSSPASSLDVRLVMPPGYDTNKMQAMMFNGWLQISIPKPKHEPKTIEIFISPSTPPTPAAH